MFMQILEKNKNEIQARAEKMSDFLRMEYLENVMRKFTDIDILRYSYNELSRLYEGRGMYPEAVKYIAKFQEICISGREKMMAIVREAELYIKGGFYDRAESAVKKALETANEKDRLEIRKKIIDLYKIEAAKFEKSSKISASAKVYEKLIHLLPEAEKIDIKKRLLETYKKLGKVRESLELEKELGRKFGQ
jgi:tetratricopeptide (TPR) repeat protein